MGLPEIIHTFPAQVFDSMPDPADHKKKIEINGEILSAFRVEGMYR
jgi:hypothetical protein